MEVVFDILRSKKPHHQRIRYTYDDTAQTVATALRNIGSDPDMRDEMGNVIEPIDWECGCLQEKCGACAMRINGIPNLACRVRLDSVSDGVIDLKPLYKFPTIKDLRVDRSSMYEALKEVKVWADEGGIYNGYDAEDVYESTRCIQCGCCLEICPNYYDGGEFDGMAAMVPMGRILMQSDDIDKDKKAAYNKHIYKGCGKSLACRDICPVGIDIERLLIKSNALAVWNKVGKRRRRRKK